MAQSTSFGAAPLPPEGVAASFRNTISPRCVHTGGNPASVSTDFTNSTPVITEEYLCEVFLPGPMTVSGVALFNGSDVTGNQNVCIRDANGVVLGNSATTAGSGTDAYQRIPLTAPLRLSAGTYFVGSQIDNTTARFNTHTIGNFGAGKLTGQTYGTFVTATMPVTFTTALGRVATLY